MQISVSQYAKSVGKSRATIYRKIKAGLLPKNVKVKMTPLGMVIEVKS